MNPQKIAFLTDSCSDLTVQQRSVGPIYMLPLTIRTNKGEFHDGVDIFGEDIYTLQRQGELPQTSLPLGASVEAILRQIRRDGYEKVIAVLLSSGLSGTYNMVRLAAEECPGLEVRVFDSKSGAMGEGAVILQLNEYLKKGMAWEELLAQTEKLIRNTTVFFSVDTLEYLQKGGRIGKITALAGGMLQIKPLLKFYENGELSTAAKVRGRKNLPAKLVELMHEVLGEHTQFNLMMETGGCDEQRDALRVLLQREFPGFRNYWDGYMDATLAVYVGAGMIGGAIQILED